MAAFILEQDVPLPSHAEALDVSILALLDPLAKVLAAANVANHRPAVEPVLDRVATDDEAGLVEGSKGTYLFILGHDHVVECSHFSVRFARLLVVPDLVFRAQAATGRGRLAFEDKVLDPAVCALFDLEFEPEFEAAELFFGDDRCEAFGLADDPQRPVFDQSAVWRNVVLVDAAPAVGRLAVEEQAPACLDLGFRQRVGRPFGRRRGLGSVWVLRWLVAGHHGQEKRRKHEHASIRRFHSRPEAGEGRYKKEAKDPEN